MIILRSIAIGCVFAASLVQPSRAQGCIGQFPGESLCGNPTAGTALPGPFTIQGLPPKGSLDANLDNLLIHDSATNTLRKVTPKTLTDRLPVLFAADYGVVCSDAGSATVYDTSDPQNPAAALLAAVGLGGKHVIFSAGRCRFSRLDFSNKSNMIFSGASGATAQGIIGTVLECVREDNSSCIVANDNYGVSWRDLSFCYSSTSYTGFYFDWEGNKSWNKNSIRDAVFYQCSNTTTNSAGAWIYTPSSVDNSIENSRFMHANYGIIGRLANDTRTEVDTPVSLYLRKVDFVYIAAAAIVNPGGSFSCDHCNFEPSAAGTPSGIITAGSNNRAFNWTCINCVFSDTAMPGTWISVGDVFGFSLVGGSLAGAGTAVQIGQTTVEGLHIAGTVFSSVTTAVQLNNTVTSCGSIFISGSRRGSANGAVGFEICPNTINLLP
jgi:hypothetical protein